MRAIYRLIGAATIVFAAQASGASLDVGPTEAVPPNTALQSIQPGQWQVGMHQNEPILKALPEAFLKELPPEQAKLVKAQHLLASMSAGTEDGSRVLLDNLPKTKICLTESDIAPTMNPKGEQKSPPGCTTHYSAVEGKSFLKETQCNGPNYALHWSELHEKETAERFKIVDSSTVTYKGEILFRDGVVLSYERMSPLCSQ